MGVQMFSLWILASDYTEAEERSPMGHLPLHLPQVGTISTQYNSLYPFQQSNHSVVITFISDKQIGLVDIG